MEKDDQGRPVSIQKFWRGAIEKSWGLEADLMKSDAQKPWISDGLIRECLLLRAQIIQWREKLVRSL